MISTRCCAVGCLETRAPALRLPFCGRVRALGVRPAAAVAVPGRCRQARATAAAPAGVYVYCLFFAGCNSLFSLSPLPSLLPRSLLPAVAAAPAAACCCRCHPALPLLLPPPRAFASAPSFLLPVFHDTTRPRSAAAGRRKAPDASRSKHRPTGVLALEGPSSARARAAQGPARRASARVDTFLEGLCAGQRCRWKASRATVGKCPKIE